MNKLNKDAIINHLAHKNDMTKTAIKDVVEGVFNYIASEMKKGHSVAVAGFGVFESARTPAREGRNPKTGHAIRIPAKNIPKFKASSILKNICN